VDQPIPNEARLFDQLPDDALVKLPVVLAVIPRSEASIYRDVRRGAFPKPVKLSVRSVAWRVGDLRKKLAELQSQAA